MNDLMPVAPGMGALPLSLELPMMSVPLRLLVGDVRDNRAPASCGADLRAEAAAVLVSYSAACRPVPPQTVSSWLHTINYASSAPVTRGEFTARADAIAEVLCNLPVGLFTRQTRDDFAAEHRIFPGAADIKSALARRANDLQFTTRALRIIAGLPDPECPASQPSQPSQAERDASLARVRATIASGLPNFRPGVVSSSHGHDETA